MNNEPTTLDEIIAKCGLEAAERVVLEQADIIQINDHETHTRAVYDVVMLTVVRSACLFALAISFLCQHPPAQGVQTALRLLNKEQIA